MFDRPSIRKAVPTDLEKMLEIEGACYPRGRGFSKKQLKRLAFSNTNLCLIECQNNETRGFIIVIFQDENEIASIETVNVNPKHRKRGVGTRLLAEAEKQMINKGIKRSRLIVADGNKKAIRVYKKAGYRIVNAIQNYHTFYNKDPCIALKMVKRLLE